MNAAITLLDNYKRARSLASDNACAGALGVTRATVSRWRNGLGHPEADLIETMCEATGEPLARWLPLIEAERARSPNARKAWLKLAQAAAAIAGAYLVLHHGSAAHEAGIFAVVNIRHYAHSRTDPAGPPSACLASRPGWLPGASP